MFGSLSSAVLWKWPLVVKLAVFGAFSVILISPGGHSAVLNETCNITITCDAVLYLECNPSGVCKCEDGYAESSGSCKATYGRPCSPAQCLPGLVCEQDSSGASSTCQCTSDKYYNSGASLCVLKSEIGQPCTNNTQCVNTSICDTESDNSKTCQCPLGTFKQDQATCAPRKDHEVECPPNVQNACKETLVCEASTIGSAATCVCSEENFYNGSQCVQRKDHEEECPPNIKDACKETLVCEANSIDNVTTCVCSEGNFYNGSQCVQQLGHGDECNNVQGECGAVGTTCSQAKDSKNRCVCSLNQFWDQASQGCRPVDDLKVLRSGYTSTLSTAQLSWTQPLQSLSLSLTYEVTGGGLPGSPSATGVEISSLVKGNTYTFEVITVLGADEWYGERKTGPVDFDVLTKKGHGQLCTSPDDCGESQTTCLTSVRKPNKFCLCNGNSKFWDGLDCKPVDDLKVLRSSYTSTLSTAQLFWTQPLQSLSLSLTYEVTGGGLPGSPSATGVQISSLVKGNTYRFEVITVLGADEWYGERKTGPVDFDVLTKKGHGQQCTSPDECGESQTTCLTSVRQPNKFCLCDANKFWDGSDCRPLDDLKVINQGHSSSLTEVELKWFQPLLNLNLDLTYDIVGGGSPVQQSAIGVRISGLTKATQNSFSVITVLASDEWYGVRKTGSVGFSNIWTKQSHGGACDGNIACNAIFLSCSGTCRCPSENRFSANSCYPVTNFQAKYITPVTINTQSVQLTWAAENYGLNVEYSATAQPQESSFSVSGFGSQGGTVQGLTPGAKYNLTITATISAYSVYTQTSTDASIIIYMKPGKPIGEGKAVRTAANQYNFEFRGSIGVVSYYRVQISGLSAVTVTATIVRNLPLVPDQTYTYTIVAYNTNGDASEETQDSFTVGAEKPEAVGSLQKIDQTETSVTMQWMSPEKPNGALIGYVITHYITEDSPCYELFIRCSDCTDLWPTNRTSCESGGSDEVQPSTFFRSQDLITFEIPGLKPFVTYQVRVQAVNRVGFGISSVNPAKTAMGAAKAITSLDLTKTGTNVTAGLDASWVPGDKTGPTKYNIVISEETSIGSNQYTSLDDVDLTGYDERSFQKTGLLPFWNYKVKVTASTDKGSGPPLEKPFKTIANVPGEVTGFDVQFDPVYVQRYYIQFSCPPEKQRGGELVEYIVQKTQFSATNEKEDEEITTIKHTSTCNLSTEKFGKALGVGKKYLFQVKVVNSEYEGNFNAGKEQFIAAKAPILEAEAGGDPLISAAVDLEETGQVVTLHLCTSCIMDDSQGPVTAIGLLVCVNKDGKQCTVADGVPDSAASTYLENFRTWSNARSSDFFTPYLATPQDWNEDLEVYKDNNQFRYQVGNDLNCESAGSNTYCNGPLPAGADVAITVVVCNNAACTLYKAPQKFSTKAASDSSAPVGAIIGGIAGVVIVAALVLGALYYLRRHRKTKTKRATPVAETEEPSVRKERPVNIRRFGEVLARYHKDANLLFQDDFEDIKKLSGDFKHTSDEAKREENRVKNRYVNILPYDHSRVKLAIQSDEHETMDFINANYIPGFNSVREYIATQGPMYCTIPDFWRMMWEQNSKIIVMLSDLQEAGKRKVDLYWPENLNEPINYGNIVVEMTNFSQLNKYIIRNFKISWGESETRKVTHFFLPGWMDFSANLNYSDVLEFAKLVRQEATPANSGPVVVHCSAGVGRTGTFIALDYFMQHLDRHGLDGDLDIFKYVMRMRYNRPTMVQAETQYIFIYDALHEVIKQKLKEEEERLYDNSRDPNNVYVNMQEENVYANTNGQSAFDDSHVYDNQAFELETDGKEKKAPQDEKTPTTVL